jgi:V/A-type H+-transporting ATPase subunit E
MRVSTTQVQQGVEALRQAILGQAQSRARELLREAQLAVETLQRQAEQQAREIGQEIREQAQRNMEIEKQRQISAAELQAHRQILSRREEWIAAVFDAANEQLQDVRRSEAYPAILQGLIVEAARALGAGELMLMVSREDASLLDDAFLARLAQTLGDTTLVRSETQPDTGGGVIVVNASGHVRYDNTFAGRLERFRESLRIEVYQLLTGSG